MTYYYYFFIGAVQLRAPRAWCRRARHRRPPRLRSRRSASWVQAGSALVSLPYWLPLSISVVTTSGAQSLQNRYFEASMIPVPLPFLEPPSVAS